MSNLSKLIPCQAGGNITFVRWLEMPGAESIHILSWFEEKGTFILHLIRAPDNEDYPAKQVELFRSERIFQHLPNV